MSRRGRTPAVPVILLTGFLGAGKTSVLNHLLRHPDVRVGVVVNDFGDLNVDAGLVAGQVDEPVSISGGCICCLSDTSALEDALTMLAEPRLELDAIVVEASGFAEPLTLARLVSRWGRHRFHLAGVIDVVDALMHRTTVDTEETPPVRYAATTLVMVNKLDQLPVAERSASLGAVRERVHARNPRALVIGTVFGRLDPDLILDAGSRRRSMPGDADGGAGESGGNEIQGPDGGSVDTTGCVQGQLPVWDLLRQAYSERDAAALSDVDTREIPHRHARSVTVGVHRFADPGGVLDFVEDLPTGVYRVKGAITVRENGRARTYGVQAVGPNVYVSSVAPSMRHTTDSAWRRPDDECADSHGVSVLVAIGESFDERAVSRRIELAMTAGREDGSGITRLHRYLELHS